MTTSLRDALLDIREKYGQLRPHLVVQEAEDPDHPLHNRFEWDDAVAGPKYRIVQARRLIRVCRIPIDEGDEFREPQHIRAFISVPGPQGKPVYDPTEEVAMSPMMRAIVLQQMQRDWQSFKRRYRRYHEFFEMVRRDPDLNGGGADPLGETA
jgi:hypothetical protein